MKKKLNNSYILFILFLICGGIIKAQQFATVNECDCCDPKMPFVHGEQIDCPGGLPFVEFPDTIYMAISNLTVELSPTYYPAGGAANWSSGQNSLTVSVSPGTVSVNYTTAANCSHTDTITVIGHTNHISGKVFMDLDGDGVQSPPETTTIPALRLSLFTTKGEMVQATVTDGSGDYFFEGMKPEDYVIRIDSPISGTVVSAPGPDNNFEPVSRATFPITVGPTTIINGIDGGLFPQIPGKISGRVFADLDGDGIREPEDHPIPDFPIFIYPTSGGAPDIYITEEDGTYEFPYLPPGGYYLEGFPRPDFPLVTTPNQGPPNTNSDFVYVPGTLVTPPSAQTQSPLFINPPGQIQIPNIDLGLKKDTVVRVKIIGIISGADRGNGDMGTELETGGLLPGTEPYSGLGYGLTEGAGLVLNASKVADVVDYVVVELRDKNDSTAVVASKPGLMLKDGTVVDECGKTMTFAVPSGSYYIALRHRNHLDIRTKFPIFLDDQDFTLDFTDPNQPTAGLDPQKTLDDGRLGLWGGDANGDNELKYSGPNNDRQSILIDIGGTDITNSTNGYKLEDINLDGIIKYSGPDNDRQPLLENIGGTDVTNTKKSGDN